MNPARTLASAVVVAADNSTVLKDLKSDLWNGHWVNNVYHCEYYIFVSHIYCDCISPLFILNLHPLSK